MHTIVDLCIMCLISDENLKSILEKDIDGVSVKEKLKCFLFEIDNIESNTSTHICLPCLRKLNCIYKFKQLCLQNIYKLNSYIQTYKNKNRPCKRIKVKLIEVKKIVGENIEENTDIEHVLQTTQIYKSKVDERVLTEQNIVVKNEHKNASENKEKEINVLEEQAIFQDDELEYEFIDEIVKEEPEEIYHDINIKSELDNDMTDNLQTEPTKNKTNKLSLCVPLSVSRKKYFCIFCKKYVYRFAQHVLSVHEKEPRIKNILRYPIKHPERQRLIALIRNKGTFFSNTEKKYNNGELIVTRRPNKFKSVTSQNYSSCLLCQGFFISGAMRRHLKTCPSKEKSKSKTRNDKTYEKSNNETTNRKSNNETTNKKSNSETTNNKINEPSFLVPLSGTCKSNERSISETTNNKTNEPSFLVPFSGTRETCPSTTNSKNNGSSCIVPISATPKICPSNKKSKSETAKNKTNEPSFLVPLSEIFPSNEKSKYETTNKTIESSFIVPVSATPKISPYNEKSKSETTNKKTNEPSFLVPLSEICPSNEKSKNETTNKTSESSFVVPISATPKICPSNKKSKSETAKNKTNEPSFLVPLTKICPSNEKSKYETTNKTIESSCIVPVSATHKISPSNKKSKSETAKNKTNEPSFLVPLSEICPSNEKSKNETTNKTIESSFVVPVSATSKICPSNKKSKSETAKNKTNEPSFVVPLSEICASNEKSKNETTNKTNDSSCIVLVSATPKISPSNDKSKSKTMNNNTKDSYFLVSLSDPSKMSPSDEKSKSEATNNKTKEAYFLVSYSETCKINQFNEKSKNKTTNNKISESSFLLPLFATSKTCPSNKKTKKETSNNKIIKPSLIVPRSANHKTYPFYKKFKNDTTNEATLVVPRTGTPKTYPSCKKFKIDTTNKTNESCFLAPISGTNKTCQSNSETINNKSIEPSFLVPLCATGETCSSEEKSKNETTNNKTNDSSLIVPFSGTSKTCQSYQKPNSETANNESIEPSFVGPHSATGERCSSEEKSKNKTTNNKTNDSSFLAPISGTNKTYQSNEKSNSETTNNKSIESSFIAPLTLTGETCPYTDKSKNETTNNKTNKSSLRLPPEKKYYCLFCNKYIRRFARHVLLSHKSDPKIKNILRYPRNNPERIRLLAIIRKESQIVANTKKKCNNGKQTVSMTNKCRTKLRKNYSPCRFCRGYFHSKKLDLHIKICASNSAKKVQTQSRSVLTEVQDLDQTKKEPCLLTEMKNDEIKYLIKQDYLLLRFASHLSEKDNNLKNPARQKLRQLARLLIAVKAENNEIVDLRDLLRPKYCKTIIRGIKKICGFNEKTRELKIPSMATHLGVNLKECFNFFYLLCLEEKNDENKILVVNLKEQFALEYEEFILSVSRKKTRKVQKPSNLVISGQDFHDLDQNCKVPPLLFQMKNDEIKSTIKQDYLLLQFAFHLSKKHITEDHLKNTARQKLRQLARLLISIKADNNQIVDLRDLLQPKYCKEIIQGIKNICEFDEDSREFKIPSMANNLGIYLKECISFLYSLCVAEKKKADKNLVLNLQQMFALEYEAAISKVVRLYNTRKQISCDINS